MKSLHQSAFLVQKLAAAMQNLFVGYWLDEIYSSSKSELFIKLKKSKLEEQLISLNFSTHQLLILFPSQMANKPTKAIDQFKQAAKTQIKQITAKPNVRILVIKLSNQYTLHLMFYARRADVVLVGAKNNVLGAFRSKDLEKLPSLNELVTINWDASTWESFFQSNPFIPKMETEIGFTKGEAGKWIVKLGQQSLVDQNGLLQLDVADSSDFEVLQIVHRFNISLIKQIQAEAKEKEREKHLAFIEKSTKERLAKAKNKLMFLEKNNKYQQMADVIMANLTLIDPKLKSQKQTDWTNNEVIEITLNTDISPIENANKFYKKAKNAHKEIEFLQIKITQLEQLLITPPVIIPKKIAIQKQGTPLPYYTFYKNDFEIRVGKSAEKNDEMITRFSHKNDTWLHAKDVAGSHVLICNANNQVIKNDVLEYAASLAAKYSKSKNQSLAAVKYTFRKYVFKNKKMTAGKVRVEKEKTILVKPMD